MTEDEYENNITYINEFVPKTGDDNSTEVLIQKGLLMQKLDSSMFKKISELRELLLVDKVSILDNLISVCYEEYTDEEIKALLGVKREKMMYQDGADTLRDSYFGIGKNNKFLSGEAQKKLLKK